MYVCKYPWRWTKQSAEERSPHTCHCHSKVRLAQGKPQFQLSLHVSPATYIHTFIFFKNPYACVDVCLNQICKCGYLWMYT